MTEVIDSAVCLPEFVAASRRWANIERAVRGFGWSPYSHERDGEVFYRLLVRPFEASRNSLL
jgi:hypothetical protein